MAENWDAVSGLRMALLSVTGAIAYRIVSVKIRRLRLSRSAKGSHGPKCRSGRAEQARHNPIQGGGESKQNGISSGDGPPVAVTVFRHVALT